MIPKVDVARIETPKAGLICKKYLRPEMVGSLWLPDRFLEDRTGTLFEVVKSNEKADLVAGEEIGVGDIIRVRWGHGTDLGVEDEKDGRMLYLILAEDVQHRTKNTWSTSQTSEQE